MVTLVNPRTGKFKWDQITLEQAENPTSGMRGKLTWFIVRMKIFKKIYLINN